MSESIVTLPTTLDPLPPVLRHGLTAVSFFGSLSFFMSTFLFARLIYRLLTWKRKTQARINQFVILICNLVLADIQQSVAFMLTSQWLHLDRIEVGTTTCWAQGWFVSTGDLASGIFTFAIAVHSFLDIVWDYRLGQRAFLGVIAFLWIFVYTCAIIGIAMHPDDFYVRAGAWCWINTKYDSERLYLHYLWILIAEFGTVIVYTTTFIILRRRVKESFYAESDTAVRAKSAAKLIVAYPIVYVVCTLPLVTARLTGMSGGHVSFTELCIAGSMITSNGWLDVLLFVLTRRSIFSGDDMPDENVRVLDTFRLRPDQNFGTTTTIEAVGRQDSRQRRQRLMGGLRSGQGSEEHLWNLNVVKAETVVNIRSEAMELDELGSKNSDDVGKSRPSLDSRSQKSYKA